MASTTAYRPRVPAVPRAAGTSVRRVWRWRSQTTQQGHLGGFSSVAVVGHLLGQRLKPMPSWPRLPWPLDVRFCVPSVAKVRYGTGGALGCGFVQVVRGRGVPPLHWRVESGCGRVGRGLLPRLLVVVAGCCSPLCGQPASAKAQSRVGRCACNSCINLHAV